MAFILTIQHQSFIILKLQGFEALSTPFHFDLTFKAPIELDDGNLPGQSACLSFDKEIREIVGVITESAVESYLPHQEKVVRVVLSSRLALLKEFIQPRNFLKQPIINITNDILTQHADYSLFQIKWRLHHQYPSKPLTSQVLQESDFDFLQRLLAKAGIFYWFKTVEHQEQIIFCDHNTNLAIRESPLIYRTMAGIENDHSAYSLTLHHRKVTDQFTIRDYNEETPDIDLCAHISLSGNKLITKDIYGTGIKNRDEANRLAKLYSNRAKIDSFELIAQSHSPDFFAGLLINFNTNDWMKRLSDRYIIIEIQHHFEQGSVYSNRLKLIPHHIPYCAPLSDHPDISLTWPARIEGFDTHAQLEDQGRYYIRYCFDESEVPHGQASPPLRKILSYCSPPSNQAVGTHFPLQNNTEILVSHFHGDPDRPFILASLPNIDHQTPVNCTNSTQNRIVTRSGNELIMEDHPEYQHIALRTYEKENELYLASNPHEQHISLSSSKGNVLIYAQKNSQHTTQSNLEETINANRKYMVNQHHITKISHGTLHYQSGMNLQLYANNNCYLHSEQHIEMTSGRSLRCDSSKNIVMNAPCIMFQSHKGRLNLKGKSIHLNSNKSVHISANGAGILLNPNGTITLYGKSVNGNINYGGNVTQLPSPIPCPNSPSIADIADNPPIASLTNHLEPSIENLSWSQTFADVKERITTNFVIRNFSGGEKGFVKIYSIKPQSTQGTLIDQIPFTIKKPERLVQMQIPWQPTSTNNSDQYTFKTIPCDIKKLTPTQYYFEVEIDEIHSQEKSNRLTLTTTIQLKLTYTNEYPLSDESFVKLIDSQSHVHTKNPAQSDVTFSNVAIGECWIQIQCPSLKYYTVEILSHECNTPYYGGILTPTTQTDQVHITVLPPFLLCNIREDATWNAEKPLDPDTIQMIKQTGNNITLFIHGYNVPLGQCGYYYDDIDLSSQSGEPSHYECTIYREPTLLIKRFPKLEKTIANQYASNLQTEGTLNGSGAHQWAISMEDNLNRAAGFDHQNYQKYTRVLHISWSGNYGKLNFIEAVKHTAKAGKRLAILIHYLKTQGIESISIIAHSLGTEVLLMAMNELGKHNQVLIDHVFLWEAAVPEDALSDKPKYYPKRHHPLTEHDPEISDHDINTALWYDFPHAHQSVQKITVLYSNNDNVLGPILHQENEFKINQSKPFFSEYLPAKILTDLGLDSSFALAIWLKANPIDLFDIKKQDEIYQNFVMMHKTEINSTTGQPFALTLDEAITQHCQYCTSQKIQFDTWKTLQIYWLKTLEMMDQSDTHQIRSILEPIIKAPMIPTPLNRLMSLPDILKHDFGFHPKPAMGYSGVDYETKRTLGHKLYLVPQHQCLFSHSGMKIPNQSLMENIYKKWIINSEYGIKKFGKNKL